MIFVPSPKSLISKISYIVLFAASGAALANPDFEGAAEGQGCSLIPYEDSQQDCRKWHDQIENLCKSADKPFSCRDEVHDEVKRLKKELKKKDDELKDDLDTLEQAVNVLEQDVSNRVKNGMACLNARGEVAEIFSDTKDSLESDKKKKYKAKASLIEKILKGIKGGEKNHEDAIDNTDRAIDHCFSFKKKDIDDFIERIDGLKKKYK